MLTLLSNIFGAVKEFFGFQSKKLDLKNAADVKNASVRQQEQDEVDATNKAIAKKDIDEIRKRLS